MNDKPIRRKKRVVVMRSTLMELGVRHSEDQLKVLTNRSCKSFVRLVYWIAEEPSDGYMGILV